MPYGGFVRTKIERDNIVKYVEKIINKATDYGMHPWDARNAKEAGERTYESLRDIAFKQRQPVAQASSDSSD